MSNTEVRLINANSFKRFLSALCKAGAPYEEVIQLLDKEPTAYDVEKAVAELGELKKNALSEVTQLLLLISKPALQECVDLCFDEAINTVKKGGVV